MTIFQRALGEDFTRLHPQLQRHFGSPSVSAEGVFAEVGARQHWLRPMWRMLARAGLLLPEHGTAVPFTVSIDPISPDRVATVRRIRFPGAERIMADETHLVRGRLVDVHARGRILVRMLPRVLEDGSLRMSASATRLRVASVLWWVPTVPITVMQGWDEREQTHRIDVSVRVPLLGEVFGYRGTFRQL